MIYVFFTIDYRLINRSSDERVVEQHERGECCEASYDDGVSDGAVMEHDTDSIKTPRWVDCLLRYILHPTVPIVLITLLYILSRTDLSYLFAAYAL